MPKTFGALAQRVAHLRRRHARRPGGPMPVAARIDADVAAKRWNSPAIRGLVDEFHKVYYAARRRTWQNTYWRGVRVLKCPLDLWIYQEILHEVRPDLIVETGTMHGGSAYYLASICDLMGKGEIVTIDIKERPGRPEHPRVTYVTGSSTDPEVIADVDRRIGADSTVLVILDSDHSRKHVLAELRAWHSRVPVGSYLIVEDTHINGHPVSRHTGPGPMEALPDFLREAPGFERDRSREKFFLSFNRKGYLKRVA